MVANLILFDDSNRIDLLPLVFTRPVADLRVGILTIRKKWEIRLGRSSSSLTQDYLSGKFPLHLSDENLLINGSICPDDRLAHAVAELRSGEGLVQGDTFIAGHLGEEVPAAEDIPAAMDNLIQWEHPLTMIRFPWDIFRMNGEEIKSDYPLITSNRTSAMLTEGNRKSGEHPLFIEQGARISTSIFNTSDGPVYIGKDAEIMEGCMIRGPFAMGEQATLKMGTKIYGPTTIGPFSKVGGELNNVVISGYTNKAHDGFLGNAVLGEWCNIGADSNNSNLKNTYDIVRMWSYRTNSFISSGLQFCGLIMGDHSKCGINTMFNTGTVVGVSCNIFGSGFQRNFIPSFSWGGTQGFQLYDLTKSLQVASSVMGRRGMMFDTVDRNMFEHLHECSKDAFRR